MVGDHKNVSAGPRRRKSGTIRRVLALRRPVLNGALIAGLLVQSLGCTRPFYRKKADEEVAEILAYKDKYPDWGIEKWHVYADPKARYADNSDPDRPPKPPDDPAAYDLAPNPQKPGKAGVARIEGTGYLELMAQWDRENRERVAKSEAEENPRSIAPPIPEEQEPPREGSVKADHKGVAKPGPAPGHDTATVKTVSFVPDMEGPMMTLPARRDVIAEVKSRSLVDVTDRPTYLLTLDQATELAMINSREYQDQRENLYLAALAVTQQRFAFTSQFFAAQEAIREYTGRNTSSGQTSSWSLNNGAGVAKILPTGALLLLNVANQTVFDFLNPKKTISVSTLNFNAIQPLLRGGGQAVALEELTQVERDLVYQIRSFARFRKELYVEIASNNGGSINGGAFQPSGVLSPNNVNVNDGLGNSGLTPGVPSAVTLSRNSPIAFPNPTGRLVLQPAITPAPSGYLNTMLQKIQVYIDQENIDVLVDILLRFRGLLEGDVVGPLQVQSVEQQLLSGRATLLLDQTQYLQALDAFKNEIGVPQGLSIEMDDSVLQPLLKQFRRSRAIIENEREAVREASAFIPAENAPKLRAELLRLFQTAALVKGTSFARTIRTRWAQWEKMTNMELEARLKAIGDEIKTLLDRQADLQKMDRLLSPAEEARLHELGLLRDLGTFERALRAYEAAYVEMGKPKKPADAAGERQRIRAFQGVISAWQKVLVEARDDQWAAVRAAWPELPRCCVDGVDLIYDSLDHAQAVAGRHALENRLDLMNVRGQVVDSWRQLAVFANALLGTFTVQYQLNSNSPLGHAQPTNISGSGNAHQLILNTELPLVRIQERNNYRAALIAYQRQRRALQEAEDITVQVVNNELYLLRQFANAYRLQQRQLELAYLTIDSSLESLQAPTAPPAPPGLATSRTGADGPAALTQQLLSAQRTLPTAQNALLAIWINYLNSRLQLYRDLELMPLDERNKWIDQIRECDCSLNAEQPTGPVVPQPAEQLPAPKELPAASPPALK
jgi:hypothetical protein